MRLVAQRVQHGDFDALDFFQRRAGDLLAVAQIREAFFAGLDKEITERGHRTVRQGQGDDFQIAERERSVNDVRFGMKITFPDRASIKGVSEDPLQVVHRSFAGINWQRTFAQITETAAIVQAHDVVGVRMGEDHRVEPADVFAQALHAEFRRRVHDQPDLVRRDIDRRARAVVFGVRQKFRRIFLGDDRHALRRAGTEKCE